MPNAQIENLLSSLKSESISLKSEIEKLLCNLRLLSLSNNDLREDTFRTKLHIGISNQPRFNHIFLGDPKGAREHDKIDSA